MPVLRGEAIVDRECSRCGAPLDGEGVCPDCGARRKADAETVADFGQFLADEANAPLAPVRDEFAGYEILGELGRGGMGVVYKARDPNLGRTVALKLLIAGRDASEEQLERFFREAESAAKLKHPNIVPIHEFSIHEGKHYFTMDFVEGTPLDDAIASGELTARRSIELMGEIARAVHEAHANGVIHRDLKPSNIIVAADGRPMVTDFGLAKELDVGTGLTRSDVFMGTPEYCSPEQALAQSARVDARSDVFSLGAVLYAMLTGRASDLSTIEMIQFDPSVSFPGPMNFTPR